MKYDYKFEGSKLIYEGGSFEADIRTFGQMHPVLAHPEKGCSLTPESPTYFMYRGVKKFSHVRFDITRILSADICGECNKTFGHMHPKSKTGVAWAEVYEVLEGEAHAILQRVSQIGVEDVALVSAKKGGIIIIPPNYGHVTINPGKKDLVLANLVSEQFESDYSMYANRQGACFYEMKGGKLVQNENYGTGFEIRKMDAEKFSSNFGCFTHFSGKSLLEAAANFSNIQFLEKPEMFY
jgi:glucose-6-phosphate isomerase